MEIFGARNPYAIAELLSNTKIDWTKVDHRSTLEGILGMEYAELFDPDVSPLFRALNSFQTPISTETRICRKAVSMNCGFMIPQETVDQINYCEERNSIAFDGNTKLDDVIQGVLPDCFLIASISAIQASDPEYFPSRLITQMDPLTGKKYLIKIIEPNEPPDPFATPMSGKMCWVLRTVRPRPPFGAINNDVLIFSHSKKNSETWCGLVEKAYFMMRDSHAETPINTDPPSYLDLVNNSPGPSDAKYALSCLLKVPFNGAPIDGTSQKILVDNWMIDEHGINDPYRHQDIGLSAFLDKVCGPLPPEPQETRKAMVFRPFLWMSNFPKNLNNPIEKDIGKHVFHEKNTEMMVEYDDGDDVGVYYSTGPLDGEVKEIEIKKYSGVVKRPVVACSQDRFTSEFWPTPTLVRAHSYAVLGRIYIARSDQPEGDEYIVLRNPWGHTDIRTGVYGGIWVAEGPNGTWHFSLPEDDGIFALRHDVFMKCFHFLVTSNVDLSIIEDNVT